MGKIECLTHYSIFHYSNFSRLRKGSGALKAERLDFRLFLITGKTKINFFLRTHFSFQRTRTGLSSAGFPWWSPDARLTIPRSPGSPVFTSTSVALPGCRCWEPCSSVVKALGVLFTVTFIRMFLSGVVGGLSAGNRTMSKQVPAGKWSRRVSLHRLIWASLVQGGQFGKGDDPVFVSLYLESETRFTREP
jgi:hypothetical protein